LYGNAEPHFTIHLNLNKTAGLREVAACRKPADAVESGL